MAKRLNKLPHMHDYEGHVRAVEEDLEYYRTKRLEPRILNLTRRGIVTFYDILKAQSSLKHQLKSRGKRIKDIVFRIRALEDSLDDYVREFGVVSSALADRIDVVTEDTRKERGDYDEFFRIAKKEHHGDLEERIERLGEDLRDYRRLLDVFTHALIQKSILSEEELKKEREALQRPSVWNGARIVARAWTDPEFKARLIEKGREVIRELGIPPGRVGKLAVVENTDAVHNVIVCTLCSCYPYDLLGDTPWWYKHDIYKKRIVENPRAILEEMFRLKISANMEIRVHDSTSDVRYMVLPRRPKDTAGMKERELARLVIVDSLIGTSEPLHPSELKEAQKSGEAIFTARPRDYY